MSRVITGAAKKLLESYKTANIVTEPTVGEDRHTAFIVLGRNRDTGPYGSYHEGDKCILKCSSYESGEKAAEMLLNKLDELRVMLEATK